jgi:hypothetical protein
VQTTRAQFDPDSVARFDARTSPAIHTALDTLTVLDPAVGSGSFLIGMMNEIIRLRKACHTALNEAPLHPKRLPSGKKPSSAIPSMAWILSPKRIEIAQLRLWLALVVEQTLEQAHPLPNLDYKLMAGNSLIETIDGEPILTETARAMTGKAMPSLRTAYTHRSRKRRTSGSSWTNCASEFFTGHARRTQPTCARTLRPKSGVIVDH